MRRREAKSASFVKIETPNLASQIRTAFSNIVANTGWRSPGALLITWSTSEVAVCCSSDFGKFARALLLCFE